jgi:hypothetical protein
MSCSLARNRVQRTSLNVYDPDIFNCSRQSAGSCDSRRARRDLRPRNGGDIGVAAAARS